MKTLFICRANVGRSQFAEAFYNQLSQSNEAESAGTEVDKPGETLEERFHGRDPHPVEAMDQLGIDVRMKERVQLTPEMLDEFDQVVRIVKDKYCPSWLLERPRVIVWDVADPGGKGLAKITEARDLIKEHVTKLIEAEGDPKMQYYRLSFLKAQEANIRNMLKMAERFRPELVEEAYLKVVEEDDLTDDELDQGISLVLYADEATWQMAAAYGVTGAEQVSDIPKVAVDYFDL